MSASGAGRSSACCGPGYAQLHGRQLTTRELARLMGRGGTSGIGTAAFDHGGFIIDGGHRFGAGGRN